jgi:hypothetical protein
MQPVSAALFIAAAVAWQPQRRPRTAVGRSVGHLSQKSTERAAGDRRFMCNQLFANI